MSMSRPAILTQLHPDNPPEWRWSATYGPYDLDDPIGYEIGRAHV